MPGDNHNYASQQYVYSKLGSMVLDNALKGFNCCLFAYGQTGAGKTYSMLNASDPKNLGIVPQVCAEIFERTAKEKMQDPNLKFKMFFSMIEIYEEKVHDLYTNRDKRPNKGLEVHEKPDGTVYVKNLKKAAVDSYEMIESKMSEGNANRTIGQTKMNQNSSRAHTIFTFELIEETSGRTS